GRHHKGPGDELIRQLGSEIMEPSGFRDRLSSEIYISDDPTTPAGRIEATFNRLMELEPLYNDFAKAVGKGEIEGLCVQQQLADAVQKSLLTQAQADRIEAYDNMRYDALLTDAFSKQYLADMAHRRHTDTRNEARVD